MIKYHSVTTAAVAGLFVSLASLVITSVSALLVFILVSFIILPLVGLPLAGLLWLFAERLGLPQDMAVDVFNLMKGGLLRGLPMVAALSAAGLATLVWRQIIEAQANYINFGIIILSSIACTSILAFFTYVYAPALGFVSGLALAIVTTPWVAGSAVISVFFSNPGDSLTGVMTSVVAGLTLTYVFYSSIAVVVLFLACVFSMPIYRAALLAHVNRKIRHESRFRFRSIPDNRHILSVVGDFILTTIAALVVGSAVLLTYRGIYLALIAAQDITVAMMNALTRLGVEPNDTWMLTYFTAASATFVMVALAGWIIQPYWLGIWVTRAQLLELMIAAVLSAGVFSLLVIVNGSQGQWTIWFVLGGPMALIFLFARGAYWRSLLRCRDRLLSAQQKSVEEVIREGFVGPILYLRAFMDDSLTVGRSFRLLDLLMGVPVRSRRFEEVVASRGFLWRPVVALGNPHIPFNLHGVLKKSVPDTDWKSEVAYWNKKSAYVLMIANKTDNLEWEIELIRQTRGGDSAIFVATSVERARNFFNHYRIIDGAPIVPNRTLVVYRDPDDGWVALTSRLRTELAYSTALDIALARTESRLSRVRGSN